MNEVEALADAWASLDGNFDIFSQCKNNPRLEEEHGRYEGYLSDAAALIKKLEKRGFTITKIEERSDG